MNLTGKTLGCVTNDMRNFYPVPKSDAKDNKAINRTVLRVDLNGRQYKKSAEEQKVIVVGINPSTAIEGKSDRTITLVSRCMKALGYTEMIMLNLFTYRQTDLNKVKVKKDDATEVMDRTKFDSKENKELLKNADVIIAWGIDNSFVEEKKIAFEEILNSVPVDKIWCVEKNGKFPVHPRVWTYSEECKLVPYREAL